ncbi:MAG TPA: hypothetical protein VK816_09115 [Jatrophihabitantaceae bacterium]|nr:hypothetical protein [Jatrophihabitantaceae bacterium]
MPEASVDDETPDDDGVAAEALRRLDTAGHSAKVRGIDLVEYVRISVAEPVTEALAAEFRTILGAIQFDWCRFQSRLNHDLPKPVKKILILSEA